MALKIGDNRKEGQSLERALEAWGDDMPSGVRALAIACDSHSQNYIAAQIGRSTAAISCVLNNSYKGDLNAVLKDFEGWAKGIEIDCPALGKISQGLCKKTQNQKPQSASTLSMRQWRACQRCKNKGV